ncbi:hypothetical protein NDU88_004918 [Pleurodeles waltl]|uniref:Uncharacterized protein n=1 Tax=Pleurodeles waltl TaxID=8319 RepID=A0AAV7RKJ5_PLEWA|nr:hypothetical protein NDU88_004918 [Pleurodeles waltl]
MGKRKEGDTVAPASSTKKSRKPLRHAAIGLSLSADVSTLSAIDNLTVMPINVLDEPHITTKDGTIAKEYTADYEVLHFKLDELKTLVIALGSND